MKPAISAFLLLLVTGALGIDYIRYDAQDPWKPFNLEKKYVPRKSWTAGQLTRAFDFVSANLALASAFEFDFECSEASESDCKLAEEAFKSAGKRISQDLKISKTIYVKALFRSFCGKTPFSQCPEASSLGKAAPSSFFSARVIPSGPSFLFPQSLVRQVDTDKRVPFSNYDIFADFNTDVNWWYSSTGEPIGKKQIDFEMIVAHELLHGLGFLSSFMKLRDVYPDAPDFAMSPNMQISGGSGSGSSNKMMIHGWIPLSPFDSQISANISGKTCNFAELAKDVLSFTHKDPLPVDEFYRLFAASGKPFSSSKEIYACATSHQGYFSTIDPGMSPRIFSPRIYQKGSSVSHLDTVSYQNSQEFLMVHAVDNMAGTSLDEALKRFPNITGILGPMTASIMGSIGWEITTPGIKSAKLSSLILESRIDNYRESTKDNSSSLTDPPMFILSLLAAILFVV